MPFLLFGKPGFRMALPCLIPFVGGGKTFMYRINRQLYFAEN
jgi:hypothetical protein